MFRKCVQLRGGCAVASTPSKPVRKSYSWFITRGSSGNASVSGCRLHTYLSYNELWQHAGVKHGLGVGDHLLASVSAYYCHPPTFVMLLCVHSSNSSVWTDTTHGNQKKTYWTQDCWMLSKTGKSKAGQIQGPKLNHTVKWTNRFTVNISYLSGFWSSLWIVCHWSTPTKQELPMFVFRNVAA